MKTSLWIVIVLVTGLVGFLSGYSTSSYTGIRNIQQAQAKEETVGGNVSHNPSGYGSEAGGDAAPKAKSPAGY